MRIDAHQHFWRYNADEFDWIDDSMPGLRRDFLPSDLKPELESIEFGGSVAVQARQSLEETRWLLELAASSPSILGVVGWVDLQSPRCSSAIGACSPETQSWLASATLFKASQMTAFMLRPDFLRGVGMLEEFDLAYDILIYPKHLPVAAEFVRHFPRQRFVLDHLAKPSSRPEPFSPGKPEYAIWRGFPTYSANSREW